MAKATKSVTVRMPVDILQLISVRRRGETSRFIVQAVEEKLERELARRAIDSLASLADDPEANDITDFATAQQKVINRGD